MLARNRLNLFISILIYSLASCSGSQDQLYKAIPVNTPYFFELDSINGFERQLDQLEKSGFLAFSPIEKIKKDLQTFHQFFDLVPDYKPWLWQARAVGICQVTSADAYEFAYILDNPNANLNFADLLAAIPDNINVKHTTFRGHDNYQVVLPGSVYLAMTVYNDKLIVAPYSLLVEGIIEQWRDGKEKLPDNSAFKELIKTSREGAGLSLFAQTKSIPLLLKTMMNRERVVYIDFLSSSAAWGGIKLALSDSLFSIEGIYLPEAAGPLAKKMARQPSTRAHGFFTVLPDHTAFFSAFSAANFEGLASNEFKAVFDAYVGPWAGEEMGLVITEPLTNDIAENQFFVLSTGDVKKAEQLLASYSEQVGAFEAYDYQLFQIKRIFGGNFLEGMFGQPGGGMVNPYYVILDKYVVFANSRRSLELWIDKYIVGQVLYQTESFLKLQPRLDPFSGIWIYVHPSNCQKLVEGWIKQEHKVFFDQQWALFGQVGWISLQLKPRESGFEMEGYALLGDQAESNTMIAWQAPLDHPAMTAPVLLQNNDEGGYQVAIQDSMMRFYLFDDKGSELWSKPLGSPVLSTVFQVDYYGDGQVQYFFNTTDAIHLIDSRGDPVGVYPISLKTKASNGALLVDFDKSDQFNYFIASANGNIYGFELDGTPLRGWNPRAVGDTFRFPLQHFQKGAKDWMIGLSEKGQLWLLDRKGKPLLEPKALEGKFLSNAGFQHTGTFPRIVTTNTDGKAHVAALDGRGFNLFFEVGQNQDVQFVFTDITGDERSDYIVLSKQELAAYYYDAGNAIQNRFTYPFNAPQDELFAVPLTGVQKDYIGTVDRSKKQIHLFDGNGRLVNLFPLAGTTPFEIVDLYGNGQLFLVVGSGKKLVVYQVVVGGISNE